MSEADYSPEAAKAMFGLRDLIEAMVEGGHIDPNKFQYQIMARKVRKEAVRNLKEKGLSNRQIAKVAGVDESTVRADLRAEAAAMPAGNPANSAGNPAASALFEEPIGPIQEHCDDCETPAEHWQRSLENLAGDAISVRSYWKHQFGDWETFDVPTTAITLARRAAREWTELARDLQRRGKKKNGPSAKV